ncbi:MAG: iron-containing alcohol dehydrogenase [Myxococcales bacterium]|jgi:alcohol dehydrogenase|nr:MAG: iron-containing alcohol dehydrogenase [Myxococcales bacterium]
MGELKRILHEIVITISKVLSRLMPDRVPVTFIGPDSSRDLCFSIAQSGRKKLLIVTDAGLVQLGIVGRITDHLDAAGAAWTVYDGVEPDPTFPQVEAGLAMLRSEGCDGIVAVGGGSPMDAAKIIAALATNDKPASKLEGWLKIRKTPVPLFAIPTTAGTGSEVTIAAVVSDSVSHQKKFFVDPKLMPLMAALDPSLMTGLPPRITAATGMDALTHALESYLSRTANEQTRSYAITAARLVFGNLPTAYADGSDMEARRAMALASYYAGLAFTRTGVGYVHAIAHTFGAYYRTPHGMANAIVLPHVLEFSKQPARARLAELADAVGVGEGAGTEADKADRFIDAVRALMRKVEIPYALAALERGDINAIARQALDEAYMNYPVPRYMTLEQCEGLIGHMAA